MVYEPGEDLKIKRELEMRNRVYLLDEPALRVAILSIKDADEFERVLKVGEAYMLDVLHKREEWINKGMEIALRQDLKAEKENVK